MSFHSYVEILTFSLQNVSLEMSNGVPYSHLIGILIGRGPCEDRDTHRGCHVKSTAMLPQGKKLPEARPYTDSSLVPSEEV